MKMNKKGFTLIEMLVVIAIIAVLVSIIIPTVTSATGKAEAATDAANLRSMLAEATTDYLNGQNNSEGLVKVTFATDGTPTFDCTSGPESKVKSTNTNKVYATISLDATTKVLTAQYGKSTLADFQKVAENGGTVAESGK